MTICIATALLLVVACEHKQDLCPVFLTTELTDGLCLISDLGVVLNHEAIDYYCYSTHMVYLKDQVSYEKDIVESGFNTIYAGGEKIYSVARVNGYDSYLPAGPMIWNQALYPDYMMQIDLLRFAAPEDTVDPRNDQRVIEALKKYGQFHAGLSCDIEEIRVEESGNVGIDLALKNGDSFDYYYLDPENMGIGLFHYFTNGLVLMNSSFERFKHKIETFSPEPWNSWSSDWLSVIESGETVHLSIDYIEFDETSPGAYTAMFSFPGLSYQVEKEDIDQPGGRVWLGDLDLKVSLTID